MEVGCIPDVPNRDQVIGWTKEDLVSIWPQGTNISEMLI